MSKKDNDLSKEEIVAIERYCGQPDGLTNKNVWSEFQKICMYTPSFAEITSRYLDKFTAEDLNKINDFINGLIVADQPITPEERSFLEKEWTPYLERREVK